MFIRKCHMVRRVVWGRGGVGVKEGLRFLGFSKVGKMARIDLITSCILHDS